MSSQFSAMIIHCQDCRTSWSQPGPGSPLERQALESRPCPQCGRYTLASLEESTSRKPRRPAHLPAWSPRIRKA